jgi:hypothetical protein
MGRRRIHTLGIFDKMTKQYRWQVVRSIKHLCPHCGKPTSKKPSGGYYVECDERREYMRIWRATRNGRSHNGVKTAKVGARGLADKRISNYFTDVI